MEKRTIVIEDHWRKTTVLVRDLQFWNDLNIRYIGG